LIFWVATALEIGRTAIGMAMVFIIIMAVTDMKVIGRMAIKQGKVFILTKTE
jgi:hypothetical protein